MSLTSIKNIGKTSQINETSIVPFFFFYHFALVRLMCIVYNVLANHHEVYKTSVSFTISICQFTYMTVLLKSG